MKYFYCSLFLLSLCSLLEIISSTIYCKDKFNLKYSVGQKYDDFDDHCYICICRQNGTFECHQFKSCEELNCENPRGIVIGCCGQLKCKSNFYLIRVCRFPPKITGIYYGDGIIRINIGSYCSYCY